MARHGENIRKRKDGRWEGRFPIYSEEKEMTVYRSVYGHTYDEAREKLTIQKNLIQKGLSENNISLCDIRFQDIAQEWLAEIKNQKKYATYIKYSTVYHTHIASAFQETVLSDLTDAFVEETIPGHLSDSICKSIYCILNHILKRASRQYSVTAPVLKRPVSEAKKKPVNVLTQSEQKKLIKILYQEMDRFKTAILLGLLMGLRLGEICALKWSDIDFENKILMVNRTVQRLPVEGQKTKTALIESAPKSACSKRQIPISDMIIELLVRSQNGKEYVFGGDKPLDPRTLQYHFKRTLEEAGIENKNFHILRHTFATNCIEDGMDVKSLCEILGHSDVQITLRLYVHPSMDTKRKAMNHIAQFYDRIRGQIHGQAG